MEKNYGFLPNVLQIKKSCRLIGQEAQLDTSNQTQSQVLPSFAVSDGIFIFPWWPTPTEKVKYHLILSRDIDNQRTLQWDWMKGTASHTQQKIILDSTLTWLLCPCKKPLGIDQFLPEILKNTAIWLDGSIMNQFVTED